MEQMQAVAKGVVRRQPKVQPTPYPRFVLLLLGATGLLWLIFNLALARTSHAVDLPTSGQPVAARVNAQALTGEFLYGRSTSEQLREVTAPPADRRDLALRLNPTLDDAPVVVNDQPPIYRVGERRAFWVHDLTANRNVTVTAALIYSTSVLYVWAEVGQAFPDLAALKPVYYRFSQEAYGTETHFFGQEWQPGVDNDPHLHILNTTGIGDFAVGYYGPLDEYSRRVNPVSNEKEIFYMNLAWLNYTHDLAFYEATLGHELQHMIRWRQKPNEETWVNEGLSELAQDVVHYAPDEGFIRAFLAAPDTQLNTWPPTGGQHGAYYGAAYLFFRYLRQRLGDTRLPTILANPAPGIAGLNAGLQAGGRRETVDTLFADWVVANVANEPTALGLAGIYGYDALVLTPVTPTLTFDHYPAPMHDDNVPNYATDYYALQGDGPVAIDFVGQPQTRLAATDRHGGKLAWWSNQATSSDSTLTHAFDLRALAPGTAVSMTVSMWWEIEDGYDYGYVEASRDGRKWQILPSRHTTTTNPSGNSYGAGFTGRSPLPASQVEQWVTEQFDLSAFAGKAIQLRFEYVTDDSHSGQGWFIDNVRIPALGYANDFETNAAGWVSQGWLLTDNQLPQRWLLQLLAFTGDHLTSVRRVPVADDGHAHLVVEQLGQGQHAILAVSGLTPATTEPANYHVQVAPQPFYQGHDFAGLVAQTVFPTGSFVNSRTPDKEQVRSTWQLTFARDERTGAIFAIRQDGLLKSQGYFTVQGNHLLLRDDSNQCAPQQQAVYAWSFLSGQLALFPVDDACASRVKRWAHVWQQLITPDAE